jgi:hypothetical protein
MYQLDIYDSGKGKHRKLRFNSVHAGVQFIKETIKRPDIQTYILRLKASKARDAHIFGPNHPRLYTYYGDVDETIPSVLSVEDDVKLEGKFEYRIGCSETVYQGGFGCIYFKLENEYKLQTSKHIFLTTQGTIQSNSS